MGATPRVARHRRKLQGSGAKRVEVTVPAQDAGLVRELASVLRAGGEQANKVRDSLRPLIPTKQVASGRDLVEFFRASPLVGEDLVFERDRSPGRDIDL